MQSKNHVLKLVTNACVSVCVGVSVPAIKRLLIYVSHSFVIIGSQFQNEFSLNF